MWRSMSIAKKIYFCMAFIILGYSASMFLVITASERSHSELNEISPDQFTASQQTQAALTAFEQEVKSYEDAVTLGDKYVLNLAKDKSNAAVNALEEIVKITELSVADRNKVSEAARKLKNYGDGAYPLYSEMAAGKMDQKDKAAALSTTAAELKTTLDTLTKEFAADLLDEISNIQGTTRRNQLVNTIVFVSVVVLAGLMVMLVVGGVMRRNNQTVERLRDIAEGEGDLTVRLASTQHDELGELSQSINRVVEKLQDIIGQLSQNAQQLGGSAHKLKDTSLQ